jgi:hypothetical protein
VVRLLVVDWDYFFEDKAQDPKEWALYDWGHKESQFYTTTVWDSRAAGFLSQGLDLPRTTGEELLFWQRFAYKPFTSLFFAESNALAAHPRVMRNVTEVWLYDAHHDSGYSPNALQEVRDSDQVSCEDWMLAYHLAGIPGHKLHVRYPRWKEKYWRDVEPKPAIRDLDRRTDDGAQFPFRGLVDRIFVCRSGAWTPPWIDRRFQTFIEDAPARRKIDFGLVDRKFDINVAKQQQEAWRLTKLLYDLPEVEGESYEAKLRRFATTYEEATTK